MSETRSGPLQTARETEVDYAALEELARRIRVQVLKLTHTGRSSHVGASFSMAELLAVLYQEILKITPASVDDPDRDRFVLSKGHGVAGLYAILAERGFFPKDWLDSYYQDGGRLAGHATATGIPGIEASSGSLGHGASIACGMAKALQIDASPGRVFALLGDGECDEGAIWEAALFAGQHELDNLTCIVDYNKIQSLDHVWKVMELEPFAHKWSSFGWDVREIDGHDVRQVHAVLSHVPFRQGRPSCVIAHTIKGKGVSFMEDTVLWHYRSPQGEEYERALEELGETI